jgi:integrase
MLKLIAPGKRKDNPYWIARGRVQGKLVEFSTGTTDKGAAETIAGTALAELLAHPAPEPKSVKVRTFKDAAIAYCAWRRPAHRDLVDINKLIRELGNKPLDDIRQADLVTAADRLYPTHKASSRNKLVITPASSILHYAAEQEWCSYRRIKRFKEQKTETRAVGLDDAIKLIAAAEGELQTLLIFLFGQGMRITDAIAVTWERVDLTAGTIEVRISKTDQWVAKALHPAARASLAALLGDKTAGRVFSYTDRWAVYRDLNPVAIKAGVYFTPHMARHSLGKWLNASGASLRTIMDALDHADPKSSVRYQSTDVEGQRAALEKVEFSPTKQPIKS